MASRTRCAAFGIPAISSAGSSSSSPQYMNSRAESSVAIPRFASMAASSGVNPSRSSASGISGARSGTIQLLYFISGTHLYLFISYQYIIPKQGLSLIHIFQRPSFSLCARWR